MVDVQGGPRVVLTPSNLPHARLRASDAVSFEEVAGERYRPLFAQCALQGIPIILRDLVLREFLTPVFDHAFRPDYLRLRFPLPFDQEPNRVGSAAARISHGAAHYTPHGSRLPLGDIMTFCSLQAPPVENRCHHLRAHLLGALCSPDAPACDHELRQLALQVRAPVVIPVVAYSQILRGRSCRAVDCPCVADPGFAACRH